MHYRLSVINPQDHVPDWELWLPAIAQFHENCIAYPRQGKDQCVLLSHHAKLKNPKSNYQKLKTVF